MSDHPKPELAAGQPAPARDDLDDVGIVHAIDGDGAALCEAYPEVEQVDDVYWRHVPAGQRCPTCALILGR